MQRNPALGICIMWEGCNLMTNLEEKKLDKLNGALAGRTIRLVIVIMSNFFAISFRLFTSFWMISFVVIIIYFHSIFSYSFPQG